MLRHTCKKTKHFAGTNITIDANTIIFQVVVVVLLRNNWIESPNSIR